MKIEELIKDLDPVSIIEFKNYLLEHLTELCCKKDSNSIVISSHRKEDLFCEKCGCKFYFIKMERQKPVFKNIYVLDVKILFLKQLIQ